jgi:AcrR family transcriptional regulator
MADRRQRDKDQTIQEVLAAARHLFSEKGLHGTSLRDIEKASGVSKGLILHHFKTKGNLYAAVQDLLTEEYTTWMAAQRDSSTDLKDMITTAIREALAYTKENSEFHRISLWSYLEDQEQTTEITERFTINLIEGMRAGQASGFVRDDIDAFLMPFIVRGTIDYWIRSEALHDELSTEAGNTGGASDEELVDALVRLLLK